MAKTRGQSGKGRERRKVLKGAAAAVASTALLPDAWVKPVLRTVVVPAHAQTTVVTTSPPTTGTETPQTTSISTGTASPTATVQPTPPPVATGTASPTATVPPTTLDAPGSAPDGST